MENGHHLQVRTLIPRQLQSTDKTRGILLHTAGLGFLVGVDIYDCVLVINNRKALESFMHVRATVGGEISAVAGPVGVGGLIENDGKWKQAKYVESIDRIL
jgi:lipid-binding SYLF domain-containing protein